MYKINATLAEALKGKEFVKDNNFNPVQDEDGNWYISDQEFDKADLEEAKEALKIIYTSKDKVKDEAYKLKEVKPIETKEPKL